MHISTKLALGVVIVLGLALLAKDNLALLFILAVVVALLTLKTTWKLIVTILQMIGIFLGGLGHGVGWVGDVVTDWLETRKRRLAVPGWDSPRLQTQAPTTASAAPAEELDVPEFMTGEPKRASDNAGLGILEPADK